MDVVEDAALLLQLSVDRICGDAGLVEPIAEFVVGLLETLPMVAVVAEYVAGEEAEGGRESICKGREVAKFSIMPCSSAR